MEDSSMKPIGVTVSKRGYIVLPAKIRKEMEIRKGMRMLLSRKDDSLVLQPVNSFTDKLAGLTSQSFGKTPEEVQECLDRERKDR
jgi:AbrB family looped-hinge helix DNA binding protein